MNSMNRRDALALTSVSALAMMAGAARAQEKPLAPWDWTDRHGLIRDLPKDREPLTDELKKFPRCRYCGMERAKFSYSRHLIVYEDDAVDGTCSIHCAAIGLSLNMDRGPKGLYVGDAGAEGEIKPLVSVDKAHYVIDASKLGTMSKVSKFAYGDRAKAQAAAAAEASAKAGARIVDFNAALREAYLGMAEDTILVRGRRSERRKKALEGK